MQSAMNPFQTVSQYLKDHTATVNDLWFIVISGAAIAGLWAALALWDRYQAAQGRRVKRFATIFAELCNVHQLDAAEIDLLKSLSKSAGLSDPARLFFTPRYWRDLSSEGADKNARARQLNALFLKLFGPEFRQTTDQ